MNFVKIDIKGNRCYIIGDVDYSIISLLDVELSFRPLGYEHSPKYKMGYWDGRISLLGRDLTFSLGLLERVVEFFKSKQYEVEVENHNKYTESKSFNILDRLKKLGKEPRYYQFEAAKAAIKAERGIIRVATGGGKTLIAGLIVNEIGKDAIIYVIGKDLLWQFHDFFTKIFQQEIGVIGDGVVNIKPITVASVWTVGQAFGMKKVKRDEEEKDDEKSVSEQYYEDIRYQVAHVGVSIMDECHLGAAETIQRIGTAIRSRYTIGLSASPWRDDNADMLIESLFGKVVVNISASELIEQGFLTKPIIRFISVPEIDGMPKHYKQIYNTYISENKTRNDLIIKAAKSLVDQGFVTMVLFREIEHGKRLYKELKQDIHCHMLNGTMTSDTRKAALQEVEDGKCKLLLASSVFDQGIDCAKLSGLILAGGGKSSTKCLQRIGRVIRISPGKDLAAIVDFYDKCKYLEDHSKIRRKVYESEKGFEVQWPKKKRK